MDEAPKNSPYAKCPKRQKPQIVIDEETVKDFAQQYRIIPAFENLIYEHVYKKHYSLTTNEALKCAWNIYKKNFESRVFAPFQFPNDREIHFYNGMIRFAPSQSVHTRTNHRKCLLHGPGVDQRGQLPIPQEAFLKRFVSSDHHTSKKPREKKTKGIKTKR